MPVFDEKNFSLPEDGEATLAMILHATPAARDEARERGQLRLERATMLAERNPPAPAKRPNAVTSADLHPAT